MGKDIQGKSSRRRYKGKLAWLVRMGYPLQIAIRKAAGYAGGKTVPDRGNVTMPYSRITELPESVRKVLPPEAQEIWMQAFNAAHEDGEDEGAAAAIAWAAVKNAGYKKNAQGNWVKAQELREPQRVRGLVDVTGLEFADTDRKTSWIEIMRTGKWDHPVYGRFEITEKDLDEFVANFNNRVRRVDLAVDQAHRPDEGAAGWFKALKREGNRLLALIEWTPLGQELIEAGIYRYFSPEFDFKYKDEETGKTYRNVLYGGGLTNRPFIKDMQPIMLSEEMADRLLDEIQFSFALEQKGGGGTSKPTKADVEKDLETLVGLAKAGKIPKLKLEEGQLQAQGNVQNIIDAWDDWAGSFTACVNVLQDKEGITNPEAVCAWLHHQAEGVWPAEASEGKTKAGEEDDENMKLEEIRKLLGLKEEDDIEAAIKGLLEKAKGPAQLSETVAQLQEENKGLKTKVEALEKEAKEAKWEALASKAFREGRLTAKLAEKIKPIFMADPEAGKALIDELPVTVKTGEKGGTNAGGQAQLTEIQSSINAQLGLDEETFKKYHPDFGKAGE